MTFLRRAVNDGKIAAYASVLKAAAAQAAERVERELAANAQQSFVETASRIPSLREASHQLAASLS